jgi:hypothetical protein
MGAWSGRRDMGLEAEGPGPFPFFAARLRLESCPTTKKRRPGQGRQGAAAANLRRPSLAGDALMARQPDSETTS